MCTAQAAYSESMNTVSASILDKEGLAQPPKGPHTILEGA